MTVSVSVKHSGICSACTRAPTCTYPRDPRQPVISCEEFDGERDELPSVRHAARSVPSLATSGGSSSRGFDSDADNAARHRGLCGNCEERSTCRYPKPDGGVWHCEEYR